MRWVGILSAAILLWLSSGAVWAADGEVLPMRGNSPDGKIMTNSFQPLFDELGLVEQTQARQDISTAGIMPPEKALQRQPYLEWKNHCEPPQVKIDGAAVKMPPHSGFATVAPYVEPSGLHEESFMEILASEFSDILPPHPAAE